MDKKKVELGHISGINLDDYTTGNNILGVKNNQIGAKVFNPNDIYGRTDPKNKVNVYLNEVPVANVINKDGAYLLQNVPELKGAVQKLRVEEVAPDGKKRIIQDDYYSTEKTMLPPKKSSYEAIIECRLTPVCSAVILTKTSQRNLWEQ